MAVVAISTERRTTVFVDAICERINGSVTLGSSAIPFLHYNTPGRPSVYFTLPELSQTFEYDKSERYGEGEISINVYARSDTFTSSYVTDLLLQVGRALDVNSDFVPYADEPKPRITIEGISYDGPRDEYHHGILDLRFVE